MSIPTFQSKTTAQLRQARNSVIEEMKPYEVDILRELRSAEASTYAQEALLDRYESLS